MCDVVEMSSKTWKETNMRPPESLAMQKYLSTVCDVAEISFKALKKAIIRVFVSGDKFEKQKTQAKISIQS